MGAVAGTEGQTPASVEHGGEPGFRFLRNLFTGDIVEEPPPGGAQHLLGGGDSPGIDDAHPPTRGNIGMDSATTYEHITRHEEVLSGEPIIGGTRTPVRAIVKEWRRGTPPEEIPEGMPHLSLAQVFSALAYYSDHQDEINALIERNRIPEAQLGSSVSGDERFQHSQDRGPSS